MRVLDEKKAYESRCTKKDVKKMKEYDMIQIYYLPKLYKMQWAAEYKKIINTDKFKEYNLTQKFTTKRDNSTSAFKLHIYLKSVLKELPKDDQESGIFMEITCSDRNYQSGVYQYESIDQIPVFRPWWKPKQILRIFKINYAQLFFHVHVKHFQNGEM